MGVTPAPAGDYGRVMLSLNKRSSWAFYADPAPNVGNTFLIPSARMVTLTLNGRFVDAEQGAAGARFYDVQDGVFYAHEADSGGLWQVTIVNGVPSVQEIQHGYGVGAGQRPLVVNNGKLQVMAPGDFVLGVAVDFPALLTSGTLQQLSLSSANQLPLLLSNGSAATLQVIING